MYLEKPKARRRTQAGEKKRPSNVYTSFKQSIKLSAVNPHESCYMLKKGAGQGLRDFEVEVGGGLD